MAITVNIRDKGKEGTARKFAMELMDSGVVQQIREAEGNLRYEYFLSLEDPETILLIDSWKNQKAIDKHHQSEMMKKIMELREKYDLHMEVVRYKDDDSMPSSDASFIRE